MSKSRKTVPVSFLLHEMNQAIQAVEEWKPTARALKSVLDSYDAYNGFKLIEGKPWFLNSRDDADPSSWDFPFHVF